MTAVPHAKARPRVLPEGRASRVVLAALILLALGIGTALFHAAAAQRAARAQVVQATEVLELLREALRTGLDAETGQRGYLLTGEPRYLSPFLEARQDWPEVLRRLEARLAPVATPDQAEALTRLCSFATAKLEELNETVALTQAGRREEALAIVLSDRGHALMDQVRAEIARLEAVETALLAGAFRRADVVEARVLPLLLVLSGAIVGLMLFGLSLERRAAQAEAEARDVEELRQARETSDLLLREMNHRVKNLFSVILALVSLSSRTEADPKRALGKLRDRIHALAAAHAVGQGGSPAAGTELGGIVESILAPYAEGAERISLSGPTLAVSGASVTPLGLVLHELATNAAKYGGLSVPGGRVAVRWSQAEDGTAVLDWQETGGTEPDEQEATGFGTVMIRQAALQLGGEITRDWRDGGMHVRIAFPVAPGEGR
ncbi:CHASE3 domain-containing protein [Jannaschia formosa]|uniref:CHASE3 domain-containing protein n=1 Tax=Jannaschia formosa TaxID=2259592 RepID=UPI000E1B67C1|nr:CHASE3 domain-containing protein [Jannaschia formosa]TFL17313.1 hypothetical protein DR046_15060 [Jannaschia formosa]